MAEQEKNKKDDIYWRVLNCALELEFRKGHLKWTMTELSRKSKITRSLIYYYFGRSKMEILQAGVSIIGEEYIGSGGERIELWMKGDFEGGLTAARKLYDKMPFLCAFYLNYRTKQNDIGYELAKIDKAFKRKLLQIVPKATPEEVNTIFAIYFGIGWSPYVTEKEIAIFCGIIRNIFKEIQSRP